jgi:hypothetical protein
MDFYSIEYALLAVQSALLDVITPQLRAVVVDFDKDQCLLYMYFYYDGEASEEIIELWDCALTEASADMGADSLLDGGFERLDYPKAIPIKGQYAYLRREQPCSSCPTPKLIMEEYSIGYALLAVQRALLGVVTPELRAVIVDFENDKRLLYVRFYYDGKVSDEIIDVWNNAIIEAKIYLGPDCVLDKGVERCDYPKETPFRGRYAYCRKE